MQYINKCKICGTSITSLNKINVCEACGSDDIVHLKVLSKSEKIERRCIRLMLWTFGAMIVVPLVFAIVKLCL